jgi:hypothetical protein
MRAVMLAVALVVAASAAVLAQNPTVRFGVESRHVGGQR